MASFQSLNFNSASQPYYVLMKADGTLLNAPIQYDAATYLGWLKEGLRLTRSSYIYFTEQPTYASSAQRKPVFGVDAHLITIEVNVDRGIGYHLVGLPDNAIKKSNYRIAAALQNIGYKLPVYSDLPQFVYVGGQYEPLALRLFSYRVNYSYGNPTLFE